MKTSSPTLVKNLVLDENILLDPAQMRRLRKHALWAPRSLFSDAKAASIRGGLLEIKLTPSLARADMAKIGLNPKLTADRVVAAAVRLHRNGVPSVTVVSRDAWVQVMARRFGVAVYGERKIRSPKKPLRYFGRHAV